MTHRVTDADLRSLLNIVDAGRSDPLPQRGLSEGTLESVFKLVPCDVLVFWECDDQSKSSYVEQVFPGDAEEDGSPPDTFWDNYWECLACCYPSVTGDTRTITTVSDFYAWRQFRESSMYVEYFAPNGIENEAMMCLDAPEGRSRRLLFFREHAHCDFDDRDRLLLSLLRPHLSELYQELETQRRPRPDLTARQWELMSLVAAGHSNTEIAKALVVSKTTVRKHLENVFVRLGVTSRTGAVARAFPSRPY